MYALRIGEAIGTASEWMAVMRMEEPGAGIRTACDSVLQATVFAAGPPEFVALLWSGSESRPYLPCIYLPS